jgi:hypothetical protein
LALEAFYVVGGKQRPGNFTHEWFGFDQAVILRVDPDNGAVETMMEYVSPPEVCPWDQNPSILFKSATLEGDRLYACTQTEIIVFALPGFEKVGYVSHPYFNDVHHVRPTSQGTLAVANTGLDMVLEMSLEGRVLKEYSVIGEDPWSRFSREVDYRQVVTTRPHKSHPNHVFFLGEELWVTRSEEKDAICLTHPGERAFDIAIEFPHDGLVNNGKVYFTTVNGFLVCFDAATRQRLAAHDLTRFSGAPGALGWCRGLHLVSEGLAMVGFSRVRHTTITKNLRWLKQITGLSKAPAIPASTRVVAFDLARGAPVWELDLEPFGMNAVFSIHPAG